MNLKPQSIFFDKANEIKVCFSDARCQSSHFGLQKNHCKSCSPPLPIPIGGIINQAPFSSFNQKDDDSIGPAAKSFLRNRKVQTCLFGRCRLYTLVLLKCSILWSRLSETFIKFCIIKRSLFAVELHGCKLN